MNALSPHAVSTTMMTPDEARKRVIVINSGMNNIRALLLDFYERGGWKALGYESWAKCVVAEFGQSRQHLYRQLEAAQIEERINAELSPTGDNQDEDVPFPEPTPIPESHLRPLASVPPEDQPTVYALAKETAPEGKLTAAHVERTVREVRGETPREKGKAPEHAVYFATIAISHLDRISDDDPTKGKALEMIQEWINKHR